MSKFEYVLEFHPFHLFMYYEFEFFAFPVDLCPYNWPVFI